MIEKVNRKDFIEYLETHYKEKFFDTDYTFYYDETENIRKLTISPKGKFNTSEGFFCLGGVAIKNGGNIPLIEFLKHLKMHKQYDSNLNEELKFNSIFPNKEINKILPSKKLSFLLLFLLKNQIYIHFFCSKYFFMLAGDLVFRVEDKYSNRELSLRIKDSLYNFITENKRIIGYIMHAHSYSDDSALSEDFYICLKRLYLKKKSNIDTADQKVLDIFFDAFGLKSNEKLPTQENNHKNIKPINSFSHIFINRILLNKKSIFDEESAIKKHLENYDIVCEDGFNINYNFCNSKACYGIQLSDVIVRLIYILVSHICGLKKDEIMPFFESLSLKERRNISLLLSLIISSNDVSPFVFKNHMQLDKDSIVKLSIAFHAMKFIATQNENKKNENLMKILNLTYLQ